MVNPSTTSLVAIPPIHTASFAKWNPDQHDEIFLYRENDTQRENYRYKLTVVDRKETATESSSNVKFAYETAVFLIPAGRESEYMFRSTTGLRAIAASAGTARLIAVTFGRPPLHTFASQAAVQEELTYVVQILAANNKPMLSGRQNENINASSIPFLALDGIGERNVLASGTSAVSGRYLVEQCVADEGQLVRRLYFLDGNPFVIQSEVALKKSGNVVDKSITAFDYHKGLTAGILALLPDMMASGVLLGLGGGGLINLWHHLNAAWKVTAVELDPTVVMIAREFFGLDDQKLDVRIGDGLAVHCIGTNSEVPVQADTASHGEAHSALGFEAKSLDFIVIDVDSKDTGAGMSCPPAAFVEPAYLHMLLSLLRQDTGVLAINVSARDPSLFQNACQTVKSVFPSVFLSKRCCNTDKSEDGDEEEGNDLNVVVFATGRPDGSLLPVRQMTDRLTQRIQQSQGKSKVDEILFSDLCSCLEDFANFEVNESSTMNSGQKKKTGGKKRRNNKRGNNKRR